MSASATPRPPLPTHPTRQQLDELDALLQRMLTLPVSPSDAESVDPAPQVDAPPLGIQPASPSQDPVPPAAASAIPEPVSWEFGAPTLEGFPATEPRPLPVRRPAIVVGSPAVATADEPPPIAIAPAPSVGWWLLPLAWGNEAFDLCTYLLGPVGRWLRGRRGRALLGWVGLLLLAAALTWLALDLYGWRF